MACLTLIEYYTLGWISEKVNKACRNPHVSLIYYLFLIQCKLKKNTRVSNTLKDRRKEISKILKKQIKENPRKSEDNSRRMEEKLMETYERFKD